MHTFHPEVCGILIPICISMVRRGREALQAPAQPVPCAVVLTTWHPTACREREEKAEQGTPDIPTWGFTGTGRNRSQLAYSCLLPGKEKGYTTSEKAQKHFKY